MRVTALSNSGPAQPPITGIPGLCFSQQPGAGLLTNNNPFFKNTWTDSRGPVNPILFSPSHDTLGIQAADLVVGPLYALCRSKGRSTPPARSR